MGNSLFYLLPKPSQEQNRTGALHLLLKLKCLLGPQVQTAPNQTADQCRLQGTKLNH